MLWRRGIEIGGDSIKVDLLCLRPLELFQVLGELGDCFLLLLADGGHGGLMLHVSLIQLSLDLDQLSLTLLVHLDLHGRCSALFLQTVTQVIKLAAEFSTLLFCLLGVDHGGEQGRWRGGWGRRGEVDMKGNG